MPNDPKTLLLALLGGIVPALAWLWFWLREDSQRPEPKGVIATLFLLGMLSVAAVIPLQKIIKGYVTGSGNQILLWAGLEELVKFLAAALLLYRTGQLDEPVDWPIYLITAALGFAALENAMFILKPLSLGQTTVGLLTGGLRFLGSTLLHTVSSALVGIGLGLSFRLGRWIKGIYFLLGLALATLLHGVFNFFIMEEGGEGFLKIASFLWIATVVVMLLFEKLRRISA